MSANRVTMRDVAKEAGVTSAAVSYALSGKRPISEETRRRVEQAIERLGYTPNMAARTLGSARQDSRLIGVVVPQTEAGSRLMFQNQFYSEILGSIELCARQKGYHVIISATDGKGAQSGRDHCHRHVSGFLLPADEGEPDPYRIDRQLLQ